MRHAFEVWGCRRVEFKTDALNDRSRGALESARRDVRGRAPQAHARPRRGEPRQRLVQRHRRRLAGCSRASRRAPCREVAPRGTLRLPGIPKGNWSHRMIDSIQIVGARGRVGSTLSARLVERGFALDSESPQLVVLCVPDRAIAEVAARPRSGRGSPTSAARHRSPRSTLTSGASACTRSSRSRSCAAQSSSTASGAP